MLGLIWNNAVNLNNNFDSLGALKEKYNCTVFEYRQKFAHQLQKIYYVEGLSVHQNSNGTLKKVPKYQSLKRQ
jgi:hypothetical protein